MCVVSAAALLSTVRCARVANGVAGDSRGGFWMEVEVLATMVVAPAQPSVGPGQKWSTFHVHTGHSQRQLCEVRTCTRDIPITFVRVCVHPHS